MKKKRMSQLQRKKGLGGLEGAKKKKIALCK